MTLSFGQAALAPDFCSVAVQKLKGISYEVAWTPTK
jgi:hypothetical protein